MKKYIAIFIICCIYFYFTFGFKILNPLEISWFWKNSDPVQQYLGWSFFRNEAWHWPPGLTETFNVAQPFVNWANRFATTFGFFIKTFFFSFAR